MKRLAALALLAGILALNSGTAQDKKSARPDPTPPKPQRTHYVVRNADPVILAEVVNRHFKGEADVIAAPAGSGNAVLISGSPATLPEVVTLLEQLDRKPRTVEVEITIAEVPAKDAQDVKPEDVKAGQRIKLAAVEGQPVSTQTGGNKPYVSGTALAGGFGKGGAAQKSISYQPVGTTVKLTARVGSDDAISLDLSVQDSRVRAPDAGDEAGAPTFENATLTTKLSIPAGKSVVAQTVRTEGKAGPTVSVVIVTARVVASAVPVAKPR
jgi:type II secretory pathway component GspD/PulD (secretin)